MGGISRRTRIIGTAAVFIGFMTATAGAAIFPGVLALTGAVSCPAGTTAHASRSRTSYGNTEIDSSELVCVDSQGNVTDGNSLLAVLAITVVVGLIAGLLMYAGATVYDIARPS